MNPLSLPTDGPLTAGEQKCDERVLPGQAAWRRPAPSWSQPHFPRTGSCSHERFSNRVFSSP